MSANAQFPEEQSAAGEFERQEDAFRGRVTADGTSPYVANSPVISFFYKFPAQNRSAGEQLRIRAG